MRSSSIAPREEQIISARNARLRTIFGSEALVWIVGEEYETDGPVWRVTLVCPGLAGRWVQRRYRYDIPSDTIHFAGEQPISDSQLQAARRSGQRLS